MNFKTFLIGLSAFVSLQATALPVVTDQAIFRDDKDANLYYFYPDRMVLATDASSKRPVYGCFEQGASAFVNGAFAFEMSDALKQALNQIKGSNPSAKFAALNFKSTQFVDQHVSNVQIACDGNGISVGASVACTWQLNGAHACEAFKRAAAIPPGIHILDLSFTFRGTVQGQIKDVTRAIPVVISGLN